MKKDFQSVAHSVVSGWIRFWFPWVRYFEQDAVGDDSFQIQDESKLMEKGLHPKDIVWVAFHETIPALRAALKEIADTECGEDCVHRLPDSDWDCVHEIAEKALKVEE